MKPIISTQELMTPREVADALSVSVETAYRWIREGELEAFVPPHGRLMRVSRLSFEAFVARNTRTVQP